ncbi:hypothetical protein K8I28_13265 [bacterium]|nr:hypothetical protein [bacterium]
MWHHNLASCQHGVSWHPGRSSPQRGEIWVAPVCSEAEPGENELTLSQPALGGTNRQGGPGMRGIALKSGIELQNQVIT